MKPNAVDPNAILSRALDGLAVRQRVVANNVANADTPNFKASEVRFEDSLQRALSRTNGGQVALVRTNARHVQPAALDPAAGPQIVTQTGTSLTNDGNNVDIEQQMALLAETTLYFNGVSEALARRFAMQRMIASEGRS